MLPTVASLCRELGAHLAPAPGVTPPEREVAAVHISELTDPTGYLSGGELLLSTGLSLPASRFGCERYVSRLVDAGVSALALGLGPVHDELPEPLARACQDLGLPLLLVPDPTPFLRITKAYWTAVSRSSELQLKDTLARQRALVDAAASTDAVPAVLRVLARALDGWAATFTPGGEVDAVHPESARRDADLTGAEIEPLRGAGVHTAASFSTGSSVVLVHPLAVEEEVAGFLAVGTHAPPVPERRQLVLSATGLVSLERVRRLGAASVDLEAERCVSLLALAGDLDGARLLAGLTRVPAPPDPARLLLVRTRERSEVAAAVRQWCPDAIRAILDPHTLQVMVPAVISSVEDLRAVLGRHAPVTTVLSAPAATGRLSAVLADRLADLAALSPGGELRDEPVAGVDGRAWREQVESLGAAQQAAVAAYLRHRGQWAAAARSLGVHRNTLRYRIDRAQATLGLELDDPDTAAALWLSLRRSGLA